MKKDLENYTGWKNNLPETTYGFGPLKGGVYLKVSGAKLFQYYSSALAYKIISSKEIKFKAVLNKISNSSARSSKHCDQMF